MIADIVYVDGSCFSNGKGDKARAGYSVFFGENDPRNVSEPITGDKHTNNVRKKSAASEFFFLSESG